MIMRCGAACVAILALVGPTSGETATTIDRQIHEFELQDFRGKRYSLADHAATNVVVVAFLGTECPLAKLYGPRLAALAAEYEPRGVAFLGINSNSQDSITEIAAYARRHDVGFPLLKDPGARVAEQFGAERTPEVFVLDGQRRVRYHGRIDDQYGVGYSRNKPQREDLKIAIDELLADKPVSLPVTEAVGCFIGRPAKPRADSSVTYSNQIARIFQKHCIECHRDGEIAPFTLTNYEDAAGWAETIAEVVRNGRMPPWHANPQYGHFANARRMSDDEKQLVYQWFNAGAPQGDPAELPPPRTFVSGWRLPRKPDQVVAMSEQPFSVPAEGTVEYQYFVADPGFKEEKWVAAAEVQPGNPAVVHHAIVFIRPPDGARFKGYGWLAAYVPGQREMVLGDGLARRVPAGSKLVFQMHYTPNGSPQQDVTRIGLIFADPASVRDEVVTLMALNRKFEIPPYADDHQVETSLRRFPKDGRLLGMAPHMHFRGKSFRFVARQGDRAEVLLDVPHYDFNWQHGYRLAEALPLAGVDRIDCIAHFDNSEDNLVNPDPSATVRWGDQTWQEMMVGFFEVAVPVETPLARAGTADTETQTVEAPSDEARQKASQFIRRFDNDGDGRLARDEVPQSLRVFAFRDIDSNGDRYIDLHEALVRANASLERNQRRERDRRRSFLD